MLNVFKTQKNSIKETEAIKQTPEANYISAKEAIKLASRTWSTLPTETIFEKIQKNASKGYRSAHFSQAYISGEQLQMLKELGYNVEIFTFESCSPFFEVSW